MQTKVALAITCCILMCAFVYAAAEQKGAQRLISGLVPLSQAKAPKANYDLNVEVTSDGSVRVIPPMTTNGPAATATSPSAQ